MNRKFPVPIRLLVAFFMFTACLSACKSRQYSKNNKKIEKEANKTNPDFKSHTTLTYIDAFKTVAIEEMNKSGIPASITLAQGILESGSGNSDLAKYANNHFGIKCTSDWKGKGYYKDDDQKDDCFRVYKDAGESYRDHSAFLKRKRYSALFELDKNDYRNWALGLKAAGYATNPKYPDLLIGLIDKYQLYKYDQPETESEKLKREDKVFTEINANIPQEKKKFTPVEVPPSRQVITAPDTLKVSTGVDENGIPKAPVFVPSSKKKNKAVPDTPVVGETKRDSTVIGTGTTEGSILPAGKTYVVQKGDTLYNISKRIHVSVETLQSLNNLTDAGIKIGQTLVLSR